MNVVPVMIRPHLVAFFFKESDGEEANYLNKKVKAVLFSPQVSTIGAIIRLLLAKSNIPNKTNKFNLFLTIEDINGTRKFSGQFYKHESGRNSFLVLPPEASNHINDLLEDIFRMAFVCYVDGCLENNDEGIIIKAIDKFIDKYDLLECGLSMDTLRQVYYREKKKGRLISRYQNKKTTGVLNFTS